MRYGVSAWRKFTELSRDSTVLVWVIYFLILKNFKGTKYGVSVKRKRWPGALRSPSYKILFHRMHWAIEILYKKILLVQTFLLLKYNSRMIRLSYHNNGIPILIIRLLFIKFTPWWPCWYHIYHSDTTPGGPQQHRFRYLSIIWEFRILWEANLNMME